MDSEELACLVDFVGAMRDAKTGDTLRATVTEESPDSGRPLRYSVEARTLDHSFSFTSPGFGMTYLPDEQRLVVREKGSEPDHLDRPHFPWTPPVLAMFSLLDLPIWGGTNDSNKVTSASRGDSGNIRLAFGNKEDPHHPHWAGYAIVDLGLGIVLEMEYHRSRYTTTNVHAVPLAGLR